MHVALRIFSIDDSSLDWIAECTDSSGNCFAALITSKRCQRHLFAVVDSENKQRSHDGQQETHFPHSPL